MIKVSQSANLIESYAEIDEFTILNAMNMIFKTICQIISQEVV